MIKILHQEPNVGYVSSFNKGRYVKHKEDKSNVIVSAEDDKEQFVMDLLEYPSAFFLIGDEGVWANYPGVVLYRDDESGEVFKVKVLDGLETFLEEPMILRTIRSNDSIVPNLVSLYDLIKQKFVFQDKPLESSMSPRVVGNELFAINRRKTTLQKINQVTGKIEWTYECESLQEYDQMNIRIHDNQLYLDISENASDIFNAKYYLMALSLDTGKKLWITQNAHQAVVDPQNGNLFRASQMGHTHDLIELSYQTGDIIAEKNVGLEEKGISLWQGDQKIDGDYLYFTRGSETPVVGRINIRTNEIEDLETVSNVQMGQRTEIVGIRDNKLYVWCTNYVFQIFEFV